MSVKIMLYLRRITNGILLSILFWMGLVLGLFIFGLLPSISAVLRTTPIVKDEIEYSKIIKCFIKHYILSIRQSWLDSTVISLLLIILLSEYKMVDEIPILFAIFKLPLGFLIIYFISMILNYSILHMSEKLSKKKLLIKTLFSPLITLMETTIMFLFFILYYLLINVNSLIILLTISFFIVFMGKLLSRKLILKGIINEETVLI